MQLQRTTLSLSSRHLILKSKITFIYAASQTWVGKLTVWAALPQGASLLWPPIYAA
jgi:hypothetical protein